MLQYLLPLLFSGFLLFAIFVLPFILIARAIKRYNATKMELEWYKAETERMKVTNAESRARTDETGQNQS